MRASEQFVPVDGGRLYLRALGEGPALVVLHGGPDFNHRYLLPELDALSEWFRLIFYDQRGRGRSSGGFAPEDVTVESELRDLDLIRSHYQLDQMALLGHSWGSLLAMEYATRRPDRASQLILMNSAPASHADWTEFRAHRAAREAAAIETMLEVAATPAFVQGDLGAEARYYLAHFSGTLRNPELLEALLKRLRADFSAQDILKARSIEQRLYAETWQDPLYDVLARLARCSANVLIIHGEHDLIPSTCAEHVADAAPSAELVVIQDTGHFSYMERPDEVFKAIRLSCRK